MTLGLLKLLGHHDGHRIEVTGWLRAAVLGANDGIVSTASLVLGVAAGQASRGSILLAGVAGIVAGAKSMAAGEYISLHSQADTEEAELALERHHLATNERGELSELAGIYVKRGLSPSLARQVAEQLTAHDALDAHARDELGITRHSRARPLQAAAASGASFTVGGLLPLIATVLASDALRIPLVFVASLICLFILGWLAARVGRANPIVGALRVTFWSALAMAATMGVGALFHVSA